MSGLVECPRCDGFGLIDVEDSGTGRYGPTSRALYGDFGAQLWVLPDGDAVAGMPRPGRYVRRGPPEEPTAGPYWIREGQT